MNAATPAKPRAARDPLAPAPERGLLPAALLALLVHGGLLWCLYWVVQWHDQPVILTAQAELWAELPRPVAELPPPPAPETPAPAASPEPLPPPPVKPAPPPKPEPVKPPQPAADAPKRAEADIAVDKNKAKKQPDAKAEKKAAQAEAARKLQEEKEAAAKAEQERKQKEEKEAAAKVEQERRHKEEMDTARRLKEEKEAAAAKAEQDKKLAEAEAARKAKEKEEAANKERERQRRETADRIARMANAPDPNAAAAMTKETQQRLARLAESPEPSTTASIGATLSSSYAGRIQAAVRPNITFNPDTVSGNPAVDIQVGLASDGTIRSRTVIRSSGVPGWDTAALNALDKTERLPRDENGRAPPTLVISLRPRER